MKYIDFRKKVRKLPLFSTSLLGTLTDETATLKVQLSHWSKKGLVTSLRRGLYTLGPEERKIEPSLFYLANQIFIPSYISMESVLAYHGLIPEFVGVTTSITTRKTCRFRNEFGIFTYQHMQSRSYAGFDSIKEAGRWTVLIAKPEKAVVDFLYLNLNQLKPSDQLIFSKSYRFQNCRNLDPNKILGYAKTFGSKKLLMIVRLFIGELVA